MSATACGRCGLGKAEAAERAAEKLALVGLSGYENRQPSELSGGQQQRVAVARAIVLEPKVLLFDEPLSNLDAKLRRRVRDEIRGLQQDLALTMVYVTHDQEEALAMSDRIIVMNAARVAQDGTPRDLYNEPTNRFIADFMGDANLLDVEVLSSNANSAKVKVGPLRLEMPARGNAPGPAILAVRPNAVRILPNQPAGAMRGRVVKSSYLGDHMEYRIAISDPAVELFATSPEVTPAVAAGTMVGIDFDPAKIVLIKDD